MAISSRQALSGSYREALDRTPSSPAGAGLEARVPAVVAGEEGRRSRFCFHNLSGTPPRISLQRRPDRRLHHRPCPPTTNSGSSPHLIFADRDNPTVSAQGRCRARRGDVVEVSARRVGDRLRVTAQLVETGTARTSGPGAMSVGSGCLRRAGRPTARIVAALLPMSSRPRAEAGRRARPNCCGPTISCSRGVSTIRSPYRRIRSGRATSSPLPLTLDPDDAAAHAYLGLDRCQRPRP